MTYSFTTKTVPDGQHGDEMPRLVLTVEGTHDISRMVGLLNRGNCEQGDLGRRVVRSLQRHEGGRASLELLKRHGGPDLTGPVPGHLTSVEQEAELLAILREIAPEDRSEGWHMGDGDDGCDRRGEQEWREGTAHDEAYEALSTTRPPWPAGLVHPRHRAESADPVAAEAEWDAYWDRNRAHAERVNALAAEIAPTLTFPGDELCETGCPYPRARALLRAIEAD